MKRTSYGFVPIRSEDVRARLADWRAEDRRMAVRNGVLLALALAVVLATLWIESV